MFLSVIGNKNDDWTDEENIENSVEDKIYHSKEYDQ